jgi:hypothetical protein
MDELTAQLECRETSFRFTSADAVGKSGRRMNTPTIIVRVWKVNFHDNLMIFL